MVMSIRRVKHWKIHKMDQKCRKIHNHINHISAVLRSFHFLTRFPTLFILSNTYFYLSITRPIIKSIENFKPNKTVKILQLFFPLFLLDLNSFNDVSLHDLHVIFSWFPLKTIFSTDFLLVSFLQFFSLCVNKRSFSASEIFFCRFSLNSFLFRFLFGLLFLMKKWFLKFIFAFYLDKNQI